MNPLMMAMNGSNSGQKSISRVLQMLKSGNPEQIARQMMKNNPAFRSFYEQNKDKTPEQVAKEHGIDLPQLMAQFR